MTLATAKRKYWTCRKCGYRNVRAHVKCRGSDCAARRPKKPMRAHKRALTDNSYQVYAELAARIHGVTDESCCACGKPRSQERHHDRDHDHRTGNPRGLLCGGNTGCNVLLVPWITAATANGIAWAKLKAKEPDAVRWSQLAAYLDRVERFYAGGGGLGE